MRLFIRVVLLACLLSLIGPAGAQETKPRLDAHCDPLPAGAIARYGTIRYTAHGQCLGLAFSPDGKWIASGSSTVRIWDAANGTLVRSLKPPSHGWNGPVVFSPDGKMIASAGGIDKVPVWQPDTGRLLRLLEGQKDIRVLAFSPNSRYLATGSGDGAIFLWEPAVGKRLHILKGHQNSPTGFAFSPDNKTLASTGHDGSTRLWNVETGAEQLSFAPTPFANSDVFFTPDGKKLIIGCAQEALIRIYDIAARKQVKSIIANKGGVLGLSLSADGKLLAAAGRDNTVRFFDVETTADLGQTPGHHESISHVALAPDGKTVAWTGYYDSRFRLARIDGFPKAIQLKVISPQIGHDAGITSVRFSPDGKKILSTAGNYGAILWDELAVKPLHRFHLGYAAAWSHDGKLIALATDGGERTIHLIDADTGKELRKVLAPSQVFSLAFTPDRANLVMTGTDAIYQLEIATGKTRARLLAKGGHISRTVLAPDGLTVAAVGQEVTILDLVTGTQLGHFAAPVHYESARFSPDSKILAFGHEKDAAVVFWDIDQGKEIDRIRGVVARTLAFTRDGRTVITTNLDDQIRLWDVATGKPVHQFAGHQAWTFPLAVSPDGKTLLSGSTDTTLLAWPLDPFVKGKPIVVTRLPEKALQARLAKFTALPWEQAWTDLADPDAEKGYRAMWSLVAQPKETTQTLQNWAGAKGGKPVERLIAELDDDEFNARERASNELQRLGGVADPALRRALQNTLSVEARRRIERILATREGGLAKGADEHLRLLRLIEALEHLGNTDARALLAHLAKQAPTADAALLSKSALERLQKHSP
ncbi:MAG: WD40 repeat domain-containing protein [Planctomycetes bacterium]|nr:WD40 repeat domain-containing protein [Planctomycetota bacterium]